MIQTQIIDGKKIRDEIISGIKKDIEQLSFKPVFCDVLVGDDGVSSLYVNMKKKYAQMCGIDFYDAHLPESASTFDVVSKIKEVSNIKNMCGVIIQLPLPVHIDKNEVLNSVNKNIDVDCLGDDASNNFYSGGKDIVFPTALSCVYILDSLNIELSNKKILVIGQGDLVGRPVSFLLKERGLSVDVVTRDTKDKEQIILDADVIISAAGDGCFLKGDMVKKGVVIIDAGTSEASNSVVGDVDMQSILGVASVLSPVPGGVGPVTVAMLLSNVLTVAKNKNL